MYELNNKRASWAPSLEQSAASATWAALSWRQKIILFYILTVMIIPREYQAVLIEYDTM